MKKTIQTIINRKTAVAMILASTLATQSGCSKEFLSPEPTSFYEPDKTLVNKAGLDAALATADRHLRTYWSYFNYQDLSLPISTEYMFTDMAVASKTDDGNILADIATRVTPTEMPERMMWYWDETYNGIKYANTVINYVDNATDVSDNDKNIYRGRAFFHRSLRYMDLVFKFKDVPLVTRMLKQPKVDYKSTKREAILQMITADMEKAVEWVPDQKNMSLVGMINKAACRQLLIKCYMATAQWQKAIDQANILIDQSGYSLMTAPFGSFINPYPQTWPITRNVIWDLHRPENKGIGANKETILMMVNRNGTDAGTKMNTMRNWLPWFDATGTTMPTGGQALLYVATSNANYRVAYDYTHALGRGIAHIRPTYMATNELWTNISDAGDLRHNSTVGNWVRVDSLKYNDPRNTAWYGKNLRLYNDAGAILCNDTIRQWFDWPHYKYYIEDPLETGNANEANHRGGAGDLYCYRLAETYLLRAEAKFYAGDPAGAAADVNKVRQRAGCTTLFTTVSIGDIFDERARELNMEEWRFTELSRASYCLALSGKADEWGNTYNVENLSTKSYWFARVSRYNNYYNKGKAVVKGRAYTMGAHNICWPIPQNAINATGGAKLWQNQGYSGYDPAVVRWDKWEDAVKDELPK
ncbi:RagB/SusD family nutrient uptake outer membrane protein [Paraflavitalea pollutisoli]|uniref:RagB/SusD family nutrient uptake outer membrane protein n=1 Tax=Paraflavitalea pollutisoli TaxID=3034143 RepID=UPI0023EDDAC4|nr:RagB/SusD family nutrient uptake outer membrane protein [Paraflavitalea sp. H1-2-19X]